MSEKQHRGRAPDGYVPSPPRTFTQEEQDRAARVQRQFMGGVLPLTVPRPTTKRLAEHPAAQLFPLMSAVEFQLLKADIELHGLREPISLLGGKILDGRNRYRACRELNIPVHVVDCDAAAVGNPTDYVLSKNLHRRHLTAEQKRAVIAAVLKEAPEKSNRRVAEQVKVDDKTVATVRTEMERRAEIPHVEKRTDSKGREQPASKDRPARAAARKEREEEPEPEAEPNGEIKVLGVGVIRAHEAINCLIRIPDNDALRKQGFRLVTDWIKRNP